LYVFKTDIYSIVSMWQSMNLLRVIGSSVPTLSPTLLTIVYLHKCCAAALAIIYTKTNTLAICVIKLLVSRLFELPVVTLLFGYRYGEYTYILLWAILYTGYRRSDKPT